MTYQCLLRNSVLDMKKRPFFKDIYNYITKRHVLSQIKGNALRRLKTECDDYLVIDDVLFRIKTLRDKNIEPSLFLYYQKPKFL